jgi:predicted lipid-binding transport protein (Tim44 family)
MVLKSFVSGNLEDIKDYTKPSVLKSFKSAIDDRAKEKESLIIELRSIKTNKILSATVNKTSIKISVFFETLQIRALMDSDDKIIDGDNDKEVLVKDEWIFERKIKSENLNWILIETKSL